MCLAPQNLLYDVYTFLYEYSILDAEYVRRETMQCLQERTDSS